MVYLSDEDVRAGGACNYNHFVNVPYGIRNNQGFSEIIGNKMFATKVAIRDNFYAAEHLIAENEISPGLWPGAYLAAYPGIMTWISANAIAFKCVNTSASFSDNHVFGYYRG